jgi:hypothetical protein
MSLEFDSDFDGYFDALYGHGESCTFTPEGGASVAIKVILDQEYFEVPGDTVGVNSTTPVVYGKAKDLKAAKYGDQLNFAAIKDLSGNTIKNATVYKVTGVQPDNTGLIVLTLTDTTAAGTLSREDINVGGG